ncbi:hypothetical protein C7999DRAFT_29390 [Corynascus novoguineensis]|uniref:Uncharacterized protein n=1 Tax=Corynascus novoguineensis TaxID=1126955 RepID=A0AAN7HHI8_9PEZI|nr:hypothetical protein C7999DRAFT_29390 [Corynascus novoguineensis]
MPRPSKAAANGNSANVGKSNLAGGPTVNGVAPSLLDTKFAFALVTQLRSKPDVDWDQIGSIMGISKKSAGERWRLMRIKFGIILNDETAAEDPGSVRKSKTRAADANAAKSSNHEDDDGDDDEADDNGNAKQSATAATPATPAKRSRKPASAGKKAPTMMPKSGKKRGASPAGPATAADGSSGTVMNQETEGGDSEDMAAAGSPMKKAKSSKAAATIAVACDMPSPLSSLPGMTADEGSGTEIEV